MTLNRQFYFSDMTPKTQAAEEKINSSKLKTFIIRYCQKVKGQSRKWKKILANHISIK